MNKTQGNRNGYLLLSPTASLWFPTKREAVRYSSIWPKQYRMEEATRKPVGYKN